MVAFARLFGPRLPLQVGSGGPTFITGTAPLSKFDLLHRYLLALVAHRHQRKIGSHADARGSQEALAGFLTMVASPTERALKGRCEPPLHRVALRFSLGLRPTLDRPPLISRAQNPFERKSRTHLTSRSTSVPHQATFARIEMA